jgi:glycosyltransferase involved in cell wall biosynthesis
LVSVVVPTYRRPALLANCLAALALQDIDSMSYEILICDDGPDDETRAMAETLAQRYEPSGPGFRYLPVTRTQGPAGARNVGWRAARGDVIAFTDDDTLPSRSWLSAGLRALAGDAVAAAGRIDVPLPVTPTDYELDASGLANVEFATANVFVQRATLVKVGGFDERFTSAWREDSDLQFSIVEAGGRIVREPTAVVVHPVRAGRWGVSLSQQKKSQFDALLYKKHPALYRAHIRSGHPRLYYGILICMATLIAGIASGRTALGLAGLAGWLGLSGWFCQMRLKRTSRNISHVAEMVWTSLWIPFLSIYWRLHGAIKFTVLFR